MFVWRDVKVRYKHTLLGAAWNVLQPLGMLAVYVLVFGLIFKGRTGDVPYPVFLIPGILLWQLFSRAVTKGGVSLESFHGVMSKIYFPRLVVPASAVLASVVDFLISMAAVVVLFVGYGVMPELSRLWLAPVFLLGTLLFSSGLAIWLTAIDANYKDVRHTLTFVIQLWMFATPVMYPLNLIPEHLHTFYSLNPMVGLVQGFRWTLLPGETTLTPLMIASSLVGSLAAVVVSVRYFAEHEGRFVDTV